MLTADELLDQALQLSLDDRARLAERLIRSLDPPGEDLPEEERKRVWGEEIERRLAAADRGEFAEGDWRDVMDRLRNSLAEGRTS
ncbi:MAG: addiction module protein [Planctomycetaceae bacterium]